MTESQYKIDSKAISDFLAQWPTERLCMLQAHAESGKLKFQSCCCLVGVLTADHALSGITPTRQGDWAHLDVARKLPGAIQAENAFFRLGRGAFRPYDSDPARRLAVLPLIKAELAKREAAAAVVGTVEEAVCC